MNLNVTAREDRASLSVFEGLQVELKPAPIFNRLFAWIVDISIVGTVLSVAFYLLLFGGIFALAFFGFLGKSMKFEDAIRDAFAGAAGVAFLIVLGIVLLVLMVSYHLYFIIQESRSGATIGKRLFGLKVISLKGSRLTKGQCVLREVLRSYVDGLLFLPALISMLATKKRQRIGDLAAGTMVIHSPRAELKSDYLYIDHDNYQYYLETCKPREVAPFISKAFLAFAYPHFIRNVETTPEEKIRWVRTAQASFEHLPSDLSDETQLRFFAEWCRKSVNKA